MIHDLASCGAIRSSCDILIIGAGTAGLVMADAMSKEGLHVICLESGGLHQHSETHELNAVEQLSTYYSGADHGRFRCLGGTSTRWGGALIPFQSADLAGAGWPVTASDLAPWAAAVERLFGLPAGPYEEGLLEHGAARHVARSAKWPPFANRNVYNLLKERVEAENGPEIWLNATATDFDLPPTGMKFVTAQSQGGDMITVSAQIVVFASGAIESTRLLMLADRQNGDCISGTTDTLGRFFHDHLSAPVADLQVFDRTALNRLVGFRFCAGGAMRNVRFELGDAIALRRKISPCFAHIAFQDGDNAFSVLRDVYRSLQRRSLPSLALMAGLIKGLPWLLRAAWWRIVEKRLLYPDNVGVEVHMVIEQRPVADNRLTLSTQRMDPFGKPQTAISWSVSDNDIQMLLAASSAFAETWTGSEFSGIARLIPRTDGNIASSMREGGGIYHPGGTTRMAASALDGVVDRNLQVFAMPGVYVVATSVLPTGGGANPTMTLLMLALRCVDRLANISRTA